MRVTTSSRKREMNRIDLGVRQSRASMSQNQESHTCILQYETGEEEVWPESYRVRSGQILFHPKVMFCHPHSG